jgi:hypothetical protein
VTGRRPVADDHDELAVRDPLPQHDRRVGADVGDLEQRHGRGRAGLAHQPVEGLGVPGVHQDVDPEPELLAAEGTADLDIAEMGGDQHRPPALLAQALERPMIVELEVIEADIAGPGHDLVEDRLAKAEHVAKGVPPARRAAECRPAGGLRVDLC